MKLSSLGPVGALAATAALLAACGESQPPIGAPGAMPQSRTTATHADRSGSWMLPEAKNEDLLYVPDFFADDVDVYSYPAAKAVGKLTGFDAPQGECVDTAGDVWITNEYSAQITEYAHGGVSPIATLSDSGYLPLDCSVDPTTGNLAVTNLLTTDGEQGTVAVYTAAKGAPTLYSDLRKMFTVYFCGYDNKGNLFVDGRQFPLGGSQVGQFQFAEILKGSNTFTNIALDKKVLYPGGIHWDGAYVALGNLLKGEIYQTSSGNIVNTVSLKRRTSAIDFDVESKHVLIGLDSGQGEMGVWNYPSGGAAVRMLRLPHRNEPAAIEVVSR
jgi:hypothetical protein